MNNSSPLWPFGDRTLEPLDPSKSPCVDSPDMALAMIVPNLVAMSTILLNTRWPLIESLKRRWDPGEKLPQGVRNQSYYLPFLLELCANMIIAGLFTHWPGYRCTMRFDDFLTLGFLRPRMEWLFHATIFLVCGIADKLDQEGTVLILPTPWPLKPRNIRGTPTGILKSTIPLAGELLIQFVAWCMMLLMRHGMEENGYLDRTAEVPPDGHVMYISTAVFAIVTGIGILLQFVQVMARVFEGVRRTQRQKEAKRANLDAGTQTSVDNGEANIPELVPDEIMVSETRPAALTKDLSVQTSVDDTEERTSDAPTDEEANQALLSHTSPEQPKIIPLRERSVWVKLFFLGLVASTFFLPMAAWAANLTFWSWLDKISRGWYCPPNVWVACAIWSFFSLITVVFMTDPD